MLLPSPLRPARLIKRYKRFLADAELEGTGETITAHVANPGSMLGLADPGRRIWLSHSDDPKRKLPYAWELLELERPEQGPALCGVNTSRANRIVEQALAEGRIAEAAGYTEFRREVRYGENSRVDFLAEAPDRPPLYIEVKSVTLSRREGLAEFPDAKTARGAKHLTELSRQIEAGARAMMLYLVQRDDCAEVAVAGDIDPAYLEAYAAARASGVEAAAYACRFPVGADGPTAIEVDRAAAIREF